MLDSESQQIIIITGPNMAGKSALLRQTALITLLAQIGSLFRLKVLTLVWLIKYSRVGASDNISVGESTFMVEMNEAADILNNVSSRSLVLFDELGGELPPTTVFPLPGPLWSIFMNTPKAKARTLLPPIITN